MQISHATAPVAHRQSGPRRGLPHGWSPAPRAGGRPAPHRTPGPGGGQDEKAGQKSRTMNERSPDPYEVLQLGPDATARDIAHAYRSLVRTHHPDTRDP